MKRFLIYIMTLFLSGALIFSPLNALASTPDKKDFKWTVQIDPLTTYLGYVHMQVEYVFTPYFSLYAGPHMRLFSPPTSDPEDFKGFGAELGARWYPFGEAPEGMWTLLRGVGASLSTDQNRAFGAYISGLVGYTAIFGDIFVLSGGAGIQYLHYHIDGLGPKRVFLALHTALGFAF